MDSVLLDFLVGTQINPTSPLNKAGRPYPLHAAVDHSHTDVDEYAAQSDKCIIFKLMQYQCVKTKHTRSHG